jgi:molybdopterin-guanine dinucleotide biosynthesis protein A
MEPTQPYAAIVLAGGAGRRLGSIDKAAIEVGGSTLLQRALDATVSASATVVVGPARDVRSPVLTAQEEPAGGGPVAAVAAGLAALPPEPSACVVVLACDMPFVDVAAVNALVDELAGRADVDAVLYRDADGRSQYLAAVYRRAQLEAAIAASGNPSGGSMRAVVTRLTVAEIAAHPDLTLDCDTWPDVERTRQILEDR